jgi:predicted permease
MQGSVGYSQNFSATDSEVDRPWLRQDGIRWLELIVRARPADWARTTARLDTVMRRSTRDPEEQRLGLQPFGRGFSNLRERSAGTMFALMGMLAGLLAIACANAANLLLARAAARRRELALRIAVGASRGRLVQQLLVESLIMAALAGGLGLLVAPGVAEALLRMATGVRIGDLPFAAPIDGPVLLFGVAVSLGTSLAVGLAPALRATEVDLRGALRSGAGTGGAERTRPARILVVSQVSLSLILLFVAGLFLRSLDNLMRVELGFDKEHLISVSMSPRMGGFAPPELAPLYRRLVERVEALPGVRSAAVATSRLASGDRSRSDKVISGYQKQRGEEVVIQENRVGPHYFSTLGLALLAGRDFDDHDFAGGVPVAIVNQAFAGRYFSDRSPLGQHLGEDRPDVEIVGVVRDARVNDVREDPLPMVYYPLRGPAYASSLDVRTTADPRWLSDRLKRAIAAAEPRLPLERVRTLSQQVDGTLNSDRAAARLTATLGLLALALACFGLYGVISHAVARRTAELGVRLALGAPRGRVLWMILGDALRLVGLGLLLGLPLALAASRLLSTQLFAVGIEAPLALGVMAALATVAAAAALAPAWRASRLDPMVALRCE